MSRILLYGAALLKSDARTGIPRVIHEVSRRAPSVAPRGTECLSLTRAPLGGWFRGPDGSIGRLMGWLSAVSQRLWRHRRSHRLAARNGDLRSLGILPLVWLAYLLVSIVRRVALGSLFLFRQRIRPGRGDTLVLLDYDPTAAPAILAARRRGARVVAVIYDLLPLTHPECFVRPAETAAWFEWLAVHADHLVGISQDVGRRIGERWPNRPRPPGHFLLGADFSGSSAARDAPRLSAALSRPCFLMVGTLEPRKGHADVLAAFDVLWARGVDARLLILGREGWLVDGLLGRLRAHPELGRRLHWFADADDAELSVAYACATALIAASRAEGFGLPLVEAQQMGLPVIAADIPVFREVGGPAVSFYPAGDIARLTEVLAEYVTSAPPRLTGYRWRGWQEATADLMAQIAAVGQD